MSEKFVIINEWVSNGGGVGSEIVSSVYYDSDNDAWEALSAIAEAHDIRLYADEMNFIIDHPSSAVQFEEYYIQVLQRGE